MTSFDTSQVLGGKASDLREGVQLPWPHGPQSDSSRAQHTGTATPDPVLASRCPTPTHGACTPVPQACILPTPPVSFPVAQVHCEE